jgi:P4 family phage/plasmid primase-like protien
LNLQTALLGKDNVSSVPLQNLEERFSGIQLLGKLANICGDLDKAALKTVATFKKVVGGDSLTDCYKGKDLVTFIPYARLVFSANEVPITLDEKSNAFFRRLIIIKMDNKPVMPDYQLEEKLIAEMPYIINKSMDALYQLYADGHIFESDSSVNLVNQLYEESDSVKAFLNAKTIKVIGAGVKTTELYQSYKDFCEDEEREALSRNNFYRNIKGKGIVKKTVHGYEQFSDIAIKNPTQSTIESPNEGGFLNVDITMELPFE